MTLQEALRKFLDRAREQSGHNAYPWTLDYLEKGGLLSHQSGPAGWPENGSEAPWKRKQR